MYNCIQFKNIATHILLSYRLICMHIQPISYYSNSNNSRSSNSSSSTAQYNQVYIIVIAYIKDFNLIL